MFYKLRKIVKDVLGVLGSLEHLSVDGWQNVSSIVEIFVNDIRPLPHSVQSTGPWEDEFEN